ncbi:MAG: hypothetical protein JXB10_16640 [Pirellulales bacterium]|nr:hypothetical protein [Pirellulales bacterium]
MNVFSRDSHHWQERILWGGGAFFLLLVFGCGDGRPQRVPISGRVLIDGQPLEIGFIQVLPNANRAASGNLGPGGRFILTTFDQDDGCVLGRHRVAVIAKKDLGPTAIQWFTPKKYIDPASSGLEITVNGPRNDVELHLTWKGSEHHKPFIERFADEEQP